MGESEWVGFFFFFSVALMSNRGWNRIGQEWAVYPTATPDDGNLEIAGT